MYLKIKMSFPPFSSTKWPSIGLPFSSGFINCLRVWWTEKFWHGSFSPVVSKSSSTRFNRQMAVVPPEVAARSMTTHQLSKEASAKIPFKLWPMPTCNRYKSFQRKTTFITHEYYKDGFSCKTNLNLQQQRKKSGESVGVRSLSANLKYPYNRTISAPAGMGLTSKTTSTLTSQNSQTTPCHRQQSVPILRGKISKDSGHVLSKQGSNVAAVVEEMEYVNVAAKTVDLDEVDKESIHLKMFF